MGIVALSIHVISFPAGSVVAVTNQAAKSEVLLSDLGFILPFWDSVFPTEDLRFSK